MDTAAAAALLIISGTESGGASFSPPPPTKSLAASSRPAADQEPLAPLERPDAAEAGAGHGGDARALIGQLLPPPRLGQRLVARHQRELREAVGAAHLLDREVLGGVELVGRAGAVLDPDDARAPALVQRAGADPESGDGADAGDDDVAAH